MIVLYIAVTVLLASMGCPTSARTSENDWIEKYCKNISGCELCEVCCNCHPSRAQRSNDNATTGIDHRSHVTRHIRFTIRHNQSESLRRTALNNYHEPGQSNPGIPWCIVKEPAVLLLLLAVFSKAYSTDSKGDAKKSSNEHQRSVKQNPPSPESNSKTCDEEENVLNEEAADALLATTETVYSEDSGSLEMEGNNPSNSDLKAESKETSIYASISPTYESMDCNVQSKGLSELVKCRITSQEIGDFAELMCLMEPHNSSRFKYGLKTVKSDEVSTKDRDHAEISADVMKFRIDDLIEFSVGEKGLGLGTETHRIARRFLKDFTNRMNILESDNLNLKHRMEIVVPDVAPKEDDDNAEATAQLQGMSNSEIRERYGSLNLEGRYKLLLRSGRKAKNGGDYGYGSRMLASYKTFVGNRHKIGRMGFKKFCRNLAARLNEEDFMTFVRLHLNLNDEEISEVRQKYCVIGKYQLHKMEALLRPTVADEEQLHMKILDTSKI